MVADIPPKPAEERTPRGILWQSDLGKAIRYRLTCVMLTRKVPVVAGSGQPATVTEPVEAQLEKFDGLDQVGEARWTLLLAHQIEAEFLNQFAGFVHRASAILDSIKPPYIAPPATDTSQVMAPAGTPGA
jgi:hypothetical protein